MSIAELVAAALATWQIVEIWHHGEIFAGCRARVELWHGRGWRFLGELLGCPWCLSVWTGGLVAAVFLIADWSGASVATWPFYAFAASRLANLGNDVFKQFCRTPGPFPASDEAARAENSAASRNSPDNHFSERITENTALQW